MDRRDFLRATLFTAGFLLVGGCKRNDSAPLANVPPPFRALGTELDERGSPGLQVFQGASEFVAGKQQRIPLRLDGPDGGQLTGKARLWAAAGNSKTGPVNLDFHVFGHEPGGFHEAKIAMPGPGVVDLAVELETSSGRLFGFAAIESAEQPKVPGPGQPAVSARSATTADPGDAKLICTREPACGMHSISIDEALATGLPTFVVFASPRLCPSRVCGPVVDEVLEYRQSLPDGTAHFIHVEPYTDEQANTLVGAATAWRLDSEPWTFAIDSAGAVKARFEGPIVVDHLRDAAAL